MSEPPGASGNGADVMIEVENLSRYYGTVPALRDVSLRAHRGEILGFLGPNGAGKTTAMRIMTGYLPPTSGKVRVAGHDIVDDSLAARRAIGYMPETMPLYPEMTVAGYLKFLARLRGVADVSGAVERVMERVAITDRAEQIIAHLSKGYRQRVGVAQALVHDPDVIILDEPTIGLDPRQIREVRGLIRELGGQHTVVVSTHILPEAQQVCDRVMIINRGAIVAEDTPDALAQRLTGGEQVRITVGGEASPSAVVAALREVKDVSSVEALGEGSYLVMARSGTNPQPDLAKTVLKHNWPLLEIKAEALTLEDIFLQLTADETTTASAEMDAESDEDEEEEDA
jgi:ABC-2 type transport system ATP-binding protein